MQPGESQVAEDLPGPGIDLHTLVAQLRSGGIRVAQLGNSLCMIIPVFMALHMCMHVWPRLLRFRMGTAGVRQTCLHCGTF